MNIKKQQQPILLFKIFDKSVLINLCLNGIFILSKDQHLFNAVIDTNDPS